MLVSNCINTIVWNKVILNYLVPGHSGVEGNGEADDPTKRTTESQFIGPEPYYLVLVLKRSLPME